MAAIDTLGYAKHLQGAGIDARHAEAHAEAARDFIMKDLATKADMDAMGDRITIRLGGLIVVSLGLLFAALKAFG